MKRKLILKYADKNIVPGIALWMLVAVIGTVGTMMGICLFNADGLSGGLLFLCLGAAMIIRYRHANAGSGIGAVCITAGVMAAIAGIGFGIGVIMAGTILAGIGLEVVLKDRRCFSEFWILFCSYLVSFGVALTGKYIFANKYMEICGALCGVFSFLLYYQDGDRCKG